MVSANLGLNVHLYWLYVISHPHALISLIKPTTCLMYIIS